MRLSTKNLPPIQFNYIYFGIFFALLALISSSSIYTNENLGNSRGMFLLYSLGQTILEIFGLTLLAWLIQKYLNRFVFYAFIGMTFVLLIIHLLDFLMNRILDLSIWQVIDAFVLNESFGNFLLLLEASGIPYWGWTCIFTGLISVPLLGIYLYKATAVIAEKKPFPLRSEWLLQSFVCIPCAFFLWDYNASRILKPDTYTSLIKSLPWKWTLIPPKHAFLAVTPPIREPLEENFVSQAIEENQTVLAHKPNIYLFVVESLRDDFIDAETAPFDPVQRVDSPLRFDPLERQRDPPLLVFHFPFPISLLLETDSKLRMGNGQPRFKAIEKMGLSGPPL